MYIDWSIEFSLFFPLYRQGTCWHFHWKVVNKEVLVAMCLIWNFVH